jgi:hypothetical protein
LRKAGSAVALVSEGIAYPDDAAKEVDGDGEEKSDSGTNSDVGGAVLGEREEVEELLRPVNESHLETLAFTVQGDWV